MTFAQLKHKSRVGNASVCSVALGDQMAQECLDGKCGRCGFQLFRSKGVRSQILQTNDAKTEELQDGADPLWEREMSWDTVKNANSTSKNDLRHTVTGQLVENGARPL